MCETFSLQQPKTKRRISLCSWHFDTVPRSWTTLLDGQSLCLLWPYRFHPPLGHSRCLGFSKAAGVLKGSTTTAKFTLPLTVHQKFCYSFFLSKSIEDVQWNSQIPNCVYCFYQTCWFVVFRWPMSMMTFWYNGLVLEIRLWMSLWRKAVEHAFFVYLFLWDRNRWFTNCQITLSIQKGLGVWFFGLDI